MTTAEGRTPGHEHTGSGSGSRGLRQGTVVPGSFLSADPFTFPQAA